jgi:hypothetical protein
MTATGPPTDWSNTVENNALDRTFTSVADEIGVTEGTVRKIVGSYIGKLEKKYQFESPEILGIDEVHLKRKMRLVFTNIGENTNWQPEKTNGHQCPLSVQSVEENQVRHDGYVATLPRCCQCCTSPCRDGHRQVSRSQNGK